MESDIHLSPQAYILSPDATARIASAIVREPDHYKMTLSAAKESASILREGAQKKKLELNSREIEWLERLSRELDALTTDEQELLVSMKDRYGHLFSAASYGL